MIKGAMLAAALLATGTTGASAEVTFNGVIRITAITAQCQNVHVGDTNKSRFHPKIPGNATFSGLSFIQDFNAIGYRLNNLAFDAQFRAVVAGGIGWGDPYSWNGSQIRVISYIPALANINVNTRQVQLRGQIRKHDNNNGGVACVVDFDGSFVKGDN